MLRIPGLSVSWGLATGNNRLRLRYQLAAKLSDRNHGMAIRTASRRGHRKTTQKVEEESQLGELKMKSDLRCGRGR